MQQLNLNRIIKVLTCILVISTLSFAGEYIDFSPDKWEFINADTVSYLGRNCLQGYALLKDIEFENGVIEVDVAVSGERSYPGIVFRVQSPQNHERFYIRPHRAGLYPDALQYTPVVNGTAGWQLYNGDGFTSSSEINENEWVRLKIEVSNSQARIFIGDKDTPSLHITYLQHGISKGTIGLYGPRDASARFSNFSYEIRDDLEFAPAPEIETPLGTVTKWQISQSFKASKIDFEKTPEEQGFQLEWSDIESDKTGLVDISRYHGRIGAEADCIYAKTTLTAEKEEIREYQFGYSDGICIFLNGKLLFSANSAYRSRDPSFLGIIGYNDAIYLPLQKGDNELLFLVAESFGGWGFMCKYADAVYYHENLTQLWKLTDGVKFPESVVYDKKRDVLYVSNYYNNGEEYISKIGLDGEIIEQEWIKGIDRPTGMCIYKNKLYIVERTNLVEVNIKSGVITRRIPVPEPGFINDVEVDNKGRFFLTDTRKNLVYVQDGEDCKIYLQNEDISQPNGLLIDDDRLIFGNSGDGCLKSMGLKKMAVGTISFMGQGSSIDGIRKYNDDTYIVSDYNGRIFLVKNDGRKLEILNTTAPSEFCADFEYIREKNLLIVPSLFNNSVTAYLIKPIEW